MYAFLHAWLSDKKGGEIFTLFSGWHFFYMVLTLSVIVVALILLKGKDERVKRNAAKIFITAAFALHVADFFLMPLAYGEINVEKLPFHACTAMCITCFLSYHMGFLKEYRISFALLGFISNLIYLIYPAGVMWHRVHPLSYRVIQTLLFHSLMTVYGCLTLVHERHRMDIRKCYRDLMVVVCMTAWALIGNYAYNGTSDGYDHFFNWFFVVRDPFYMLPETVAPFIMPFLNIALFFAVEMLIHFLIWSTRRIKR